MRTFLLQWQDLPRGGGDVGDGDGPCPRGDEIRQPLQGLRCRGHGRLEYAHPDPVTSLPSQPGDGIAYMFVRRRDDLIAGFQGKAIADDVDAFGRIARVGDLVRIAAENAGGAALGRLP